MNSPGISFIFPYYNKAKALPQMGKMLEFLSEQFNGNLEFIFIDDGSSSEDSKALSEFTQTHSKKELIHLIKSPKNMGKGASIVTGSQKATYETLVFCDADAAFKEEDVLALAQKSYENQSAIVVANRVGAQENNQSLLRSFASRSFRMACRYSLNVPCHDIQAGLKACPAKWFNEHQWRNKRFALDVELLRQARVDGLNIYESAVSTVDYSYESSVKLGRAAFDLCRELMGPLGRKAFWLAALLVVLCNTRAFSTNSAVTWDARDEMFFYFRWLGSAFQSGYFGDFIPNIAAGYPIGANPQAGVYNLFYFPFWAMFPDSVLSINMLYLVLQLCIFTSSYVLFYTLRFAPAIAAIAALSVVGNGFVTAHASHFSYLSTYLSWIICFLGVSFAAGRGHKFLGFLCMMLGVYHMGSAGYPGLWVSGAQVFALVVFYLMLTGRCGLRALSAIALGGLTGLALAAPAFAHFLNQLSLWPRKAGVSVDEILGNALPAGALLNFFNPFLNMGELAGTLDPTMIRFHISLVCLIGLMTGIIMLLRSRFPQKYRRDFYALAGLGMLCTFLAFGDSLGLPLKRWLAESFLIHRVTRFPSGEFRGFALLAFSAASLFGLHALWAKLQNLNLKKYKIASRAVVAFVTIDFALIMIVTLGLRYMRLPEEMRGQQEIFQVEYSGAAGRAQLDTPRGCPFDPRYEFDQRLTPPDKFSWNGYTNLLPQAYTEERESLKWALCGESRFWDYGAKQPQDYVLEMYSPAKIEFTFVAKGDPRTYLWADVQDGYWKLWINGVKGEFTQGPASLRYFKLPDHLTGKNVKITMVYAGPLSRFWRQ